MLVIEEPLRLAGRWTLRAFQGDVEYDDAGNPDRPALWVVERDNLITDTGKALSLDRLYGLASVAALSHTGVGTSSTAPAAGNTTLTGGVYKGFDATPTRSSLTVTSTTTFGTSEANIAIAELALSNGSPGTMFNRIAPIGPITKTSAISLAVTVQVTQA